MTTTMTLIQTIEKPQRLNMSYEAYLEFATEDQLTEWVDGEVIIMPPPTTRHQDILSFLDRLLGLFVAYFKLGKVMVAPVEVRLWADGPARQPDVLFVSTEKLSQLDERRLEGGPNLVIEIISPGSVTEDRQRKFGEYEQAGVAEYWIIDPRPYQEHAEFFVLNDDGKYESALLDDHGRFFSSVLPNLWIDANWFKSADLPDPQRTLAKIMLTIETLPAEAKQAYQTLYNLLSS